MHVPQKFDFRRKVEALLTKPLPKPTISDEEDQDEWMTPTINVLGTDYRDAITYLSPDQDQRTNHG